MTQFTMHYKYLWIAWIVAGVILEAVTLFNRRRGDTLSENVWRWMEHKAVTWFVVCFLIWLLVHWLSRGKWA